MNDPRPPQGAQTALRAVRLLKLFSIERPEMSLAELSKASGLNKTTTHRLLSALQSEGLIERNSLTAGYYLGAGLMALGVQALASFFLPRLDSHCIKTAIVRYFSGSRYCLASADLAVTALPTNDSVKARGTTTSNWANAYTNFPVLTSVSAISTFTPGPSRPWQLPSSNSKSEALSRKSA